MVSRAAVMAGARHHGSLRSVLSAICARVLDDVTVACVMLDVLVCCALTLAARKCPGLPMNLFQSTSPCGCWVPFRRCDTGYSRLIRGVTLATPMLICGNASCAAGHRRECGRRRWPGTTGAAQFPGTTSVRGGASLASRYAQGAVMPAVLHPLSEREHRLGDHAGRRIGDRSGGLVEDEQPCPGDLARDRLAVADGEEPVAAAMDDERGDLDLGQALAPAGCAVEPGKHHAHLVGHLDRGCGAGRAVPDARGGCACGDGVVAENLRAGGGELRNRLAVGPIGHRTREQRAHRLLVMAGEEIGRA